MESWLKELRFNPFPDVDSLANEALRYYVKRDLFDEDVGPVNALWESAEVIHILRKQEEDGSWRYPGKEKAHFLKRDYALLEVFKNLGILVEKYGLNSQNPAVSRAAKYVFSCQSEEGDIRGILGNQYMPYYCGAIMALLIEAGYQEEPSIERAFRWLLSTRQDDGGWVIPFQTIGDKKAKRREEFWTSEPIHSEKSKPSSHLATGMVLRAFAAHPRYRSSVAAREAGQLLKSRFFKPDRYLDRKNPLYWTKFRYPFFWTDLLSSLDSLSLIGFTRDDEDIEKALRWFVENQQPNGLWITEYEKAKDREMSRWVALSVCRVFKRFYG